MKEFKINDHLTAVVEGCSDYGYSGYIREMPECISEGKTITDLKSNLLEAYFIFTKHIYNEQTKAH